MAKALLRAVSGAAVLAGWVYLLLRQRGGFAAGPYRVFGLELACAATVAWLAEAAVALAPAGKRRPLALRLAVALVALLTTAVVCDAGYVVWAARVHRFWYYGQSFSYLEHVHDPELVWRFRPGFRYQGRAKPFCYDVLFRTDENGFRNPPGVRQADLVFLGDSVTMAAEVAEDATFVRKAAGATGLSAVNLGLFGYGPQQELAALKRYGTAYHPRAVVWQVTEWNDCVDAERFARRAHPDKPQMRPWPELYETYSPIGRRVIKAFPREKPKDNPNIVIFQRTDGLADIRLVWPYEDEAAASPSGLEITGRTIAEAREFCRSRGIAFAVLFVPTHPRVLGPHVLPRSRAERERYVPREGLDRPGDFAHALADLCKRIDAPLIDLTGPLRRRAEADNTHLYIKHDPHLDVDGHDEAANQVARWLCSAEGLALAPANLRR